MRNLIATFSIYGFTLFSFLTGCGPITESNMDSINLAGTWQFRIDSLDIGIDQKWYNSDFDDTVKLPGSLTENGKGYDVNLNTKWTGSIVDRSILYSN